MKHQIGYYLLVFQSDSFFGKNHHKMNLPSQDFYLVFQWLFLAFESFFVYYFDCIHHWGIVLALGKSHLRECSAEKQNKKWNDAQKSTQIVSKHDTDVFKGKMNDKGRDWERKVTKSTQHSIPCFMFYEYMHILYTVQYRHACKTVSCSFFAQVLFCCHGKCQAKLKKAWGNPWCSKICILHY